MSEMTNSGELLLPVCIPESHIRDLISAIDLYRVMRKGGQEYVAFNAVLQAIDIIDTPELAPCLDVPGNNAGTCFRMDATTEIFEFYPNNPFDTTDDEKTVLGMSWVRFGDIIQDNAPEWLQNALENAADRVGYFENDCFIAYDVSANPFDILITNSLENFFNAFRDKNINPFPTVTLRFSGVGQLEIEFAQVPFGGAVLVVWDFNPELNDILDVIQNKPNSLTNFQIIEVNRDLIGLPPELVTTNVWEQQFDDDIEHVVRCYFTPSGQLEPPFFLPFGGIREVEFCGVTAIGSETGNTYNQFNYRDRQVIRQGVIGAMTSQEICDGFICAIEKVSARILSGQETNLKNAIEVAVNGTVSQQDSTQSVIELPDNVTNQEIAHGRAVSVATGFRDLVTEIITWNASATNIGAIIDRVARFYQMVFSGDINGALATAFEADLAAAIADATDIVNPVVNIQQLANLIYCNGNNKATLYRYALEVEESGGTDATDIATLYRVIIDSLELAQLEAWYNDANVEPSINFVDAPCYRFPVMKVTVTAPELAINRAYSLLPPHSAPHSGSFARRYRLEISGEIMLSDGRVFNGVTLTDNSTSSNVLTDITIQSGYARIELPNDYKIINNKIVAEVDLRNQFINIAQSHKVVFAVVNNSWTALADTGQIRVSLYDLGRT